MVVCGRGASGIVVCAEGESREPAVVWLCRGRWEDEKAIVDRAAALVFAEYTPGLVIYYDKGAEQRLIEEVELNPAFAGLASGVVYLQHKIWQPKALVLQVDKARVPYTVNTENPEHIEFGPVFQDDYAVITVTAFGSNERELIAGARLRVSPKLDTWDGAVNYADPSIRHVWVTTGADGSASLVYTPGRSYGYYIDPGNECHR